MIINSFYFFAFPNLYLSHHVDPKNDNMSYHDYSQSHVVEAKTWLLLFIILMLY